MDIADNPQSGDTTIEKNGLKVFLEMKAQGMLMNTTIDFQDGRGFMITGMQQQGNSCGSCSC
ncbi:MAG: hypothetical protein A2X56_11195 [Nitrospirae bacterium GWC2_57_13]|jgi:Fe-S cluster assembly iron-binding protein IscA|nr:MAG: hypothetical protein A2072_07145 [Nitrospirae bacterium GWC1_57_7]OGW27475.1 MAG: hypothetical protein A2X56_11195 [Nitrospirae bacterium GWC2_57_13]OGW46237.1 MAG: hypothetical protein A2X57_05640 [Nitrospirae bacterium GWD2_57_8]HAR44783.1 hypothetical protein [Nitrospiraceae bacterium]HAS53707.1 hypothetical protein [Nitrospiraceae bacterium]